MKPLFACLLAVAAWFGATTARAEVNVELLVTPTTGTGTPSLRISGFPDQSEVTLDNNNGPKLVPMILDQNMILTVDMTNMSKVRLSFQAPGPQGVLIEGVRRSSIELTGGSGTVSLPVRVTLVQAGERGPGGRVALGEPSPVSLPLPTVNPPTPDRAPYLTFNLGDATNGTALPPLRVPLWKREAGGPGFIPPDSPDISYTEATGEFEVFAPQVKAALTLDGASAGDFYLKFYAPATSGVDPWQTTPFVTYRFQFTSWAVTMGSISGTATVTRTPASGGRVYTTVWSGHLGPIGGSDIGAWSIQEWNTGSVIAERTGVRTQQFHGGTSFPGMYFLTRTYTDVVEVRAGVGGTVVGKKKYVYKHYGYHNYDDTLSGMAPYLAEETDGFGGGDYVTQFLSHPAISAISGSISPSGRTTIDLKDSAAESIMRFETWLGDGSNPSPTVSTTSSPPISVNGGSQTVTALELDSKWRDFAWPANVEQKVGTKVIAKAGVSYAETIVDAGDSGTADDLIVVTATRRDYEALGGNYVETITKKYRPDTPDPALRDRIYAVQHPDGSKQSFAYEHGTYAGGTSFTPGASGKDLRITMLSGTATGVSGASTITGLSSVAMDAIGLHANRSTKTVTYMKRGRVARQEVWVYVSGSGTSPTFNSTAPIAYEEFTYTVDGRLQSRTSSNGASLTATWDGTRKTDETDETGHTTDFTYDAMDRVTTLTRRSVGAVPAQRTAIEYDAANRIRFRKVGPSGGEQLVSETQYDLGGRVKKVIAPGGATVDYTYANGDRDVTETYPPGSLGETATRTVVRFPDGRVKSVTGSAVAVPEYYTYDFDANQRPRVTVNLGSSSGRARSTSYDLLGRVREERSNGFTPAVGSAKPIVTTQAYNARGLLDTVATFEEGGVGALSADKVFEYDAFGVVKAAGLNLNGQAGLQDASNDRYATTETAFEKDGSDVWWSAVTRKVYHTDGSGSYHTATTKTRLTGFSSGLVAETKSTDFYNNPSSEVITVNTTAKTRKITSTAVDGTKRERTFLGGLLIRDETFSAASSPTSQVTVHTYDAQGRLDTSTDPRSIVNRLEYFADTARVKKLHGRNEAGTETALAIYAYDSAGRLSSTTDANGSVTTTAYYPTGQVSGRSGTGTRPTHYVYDEYGQQTELWTYRTSGGSADKTIWTYDTNTGWLKSKKDAANRTVSYAYSYSGPHKLVVRTSPRSSLSTTYRYRIDTGELASIDYSDATPDVAYTYTRTGRILGVDDATGHRSFEYDREQQSAEALDSAWYGNGGLRLTTLFETGSHNPTGNVIPGRYAGFKLGVSGDLARELQAMFGYDEFGRIDSLDTVYAAQGARSQLSTSATYEYATGTDIWKKFAQGSYTLNRTPETYRDLLSVVSAKWSSTVLTEHAYKTNDAGERTSIVQKGAAFEDFGTSDAGATFFKYQYETTGDLKRADGYRGGTVSDTSKPLAGRSYQFTYDDAGNRTGAQVDSETAPYTDASSASGINNLNQVTARKTLKTHFSGTSISAATVTVGATTASRLSGERYWDAAANLFGQHTQVSISATDGSQTETMDRWTTFRPLQEALIYDEEGNLTGDAQWNYQWDAENRLIRMTTKSTGDLATLGWTSNPPPREITFHYDYLGRRVEKVSYENGTLAYKQRYLYDGWNLIAEFEFTGAVGKITRSYVWGLDVQGTLAANGGVGALTMQVVHTDATLTPFHVANDASGNVTALVNGSGAVVGSYEYDPFGQVLRVEGQHAAANPFRFSSKFYDSETKLLYYGFRYYDPNLGRFINRDPIGEEGGDNLYAFVGNSPVGRWDVLGLSDEPGRPQPPYNPGAPGYYLPPDEDDETPTSYDTVYSDPGKRSNPQETRIGETSRQNDAIIADLFGRPRMVTSTVTGRTYPEGGDPGYPGNHVFARQVGAGVHALGSAAEIVAGALTAKTGVGVAMIVHGVDNLQAAIRNLSGESDAQPLIVVAVNKATGIEGAGQVANIYVGYGLGMSSALQGARTAGLSGPVEFRAPPGATAEQIAQVKAYVQGFQDAVDAGYVSAAGRVSTKGSLRTEASVAAAEERARAAAAGTSYGAQHAGHVPDTTWTGRAEPHSWLPLDPKVNSSLGGQANRYPLGYKPTVIIFVE